MFNDVKNEIYQFLNESDNTRVINDHFEQDLKKYYDDVSPQHVDKDFFIGCDHIYQETELK